MSGSSMSSRTMSGCSARVWAMPDAPSMAITSSTSGRRSTTCWISIALMELSSM